MPTERRCEKCGAVLAAFGPTALCPNCMLREAIRLGADLTAQPAAAGPGKGAAVVTTPVTEKVGDRIGRYKLLQPIGEGGMGVVYMAEQEEPVRRRVALKVIKLGMDTKSVIARFEAERQALALMDHPNIAKVLDAGATDTGRPYFVMELVRGIRITDYCDQNHLATRQRLDLFTQICKAIQHAHQKGIIHRDIKPSNILVTLHDGVPVPKIIDFGIAKATSDQRLTDKTLFTAFEQFVGTPAYMSPEQAELSGLDIDTRSDIYSLGVLLYELLTGQTPFEAKELLAAGLDAMRRTIREKEPPKPSTRLSAMGMADTADVTNRFKLSPAKLAALVRGDLDWIVMKALEKDRARRYESANGLAMDIQRHLANEPVVARPPSNLYRFQKLVRRNKLAFMAGAFVTAALVLGLVVSSWQAIRATRSERAQSRLREKSQQIGRFLKETLEAAGPGVAQGRDATLLREILDKTASRIGQELTNQPEVAIELRVILAETYGQLGRFDRQEQIAQAAIQLAPEATQKTAAFTEALMLLGEAQNSLGRMAEAETNYNKALQIRKKIFGERDLTVADCLAELGLLSYERMMLPEAETLLRQAVEVIHRAEDHDDDLLGRALHDLALVLKDRGKFDEAERFERQALEVRRKAYGEVHPDVAESLNNLGIILQDQDRLDAAEKTFRQVLELRRKILGDKHVDVACTLNNLSGLLQEQGKLPASESMMRQSLAICLETMDTNHQDLAIAKANLADILQEEGKLDEAEPLCRDALRIWRDKFSNTNLLFSRGMHYLAKILREQNRLADAESAIHEALDIRRKQLNKHLQVASSLSVLASILRLEGRLTEAETFAHEALVMRQELEGNEHRDVAASLSQLAQLLLDQQKPIEAAKYALACLAIREQKLPDNWQTCADQSVLGDALLQQRKYGEAEPNLISGYQRLKRLEDTIPPKRKIAVKEAIERLVKLYEATDRPALAAEWKQKLEAFGQPAPATNSAVGTKPK